MTKDEFREVARGIRLYGASEMSIGRAKDIRQHDPVLADKIEAFGAAKEDIRTYLKGRVEGGYPHVPQGSGRVEF